MSPDRLGFGLVQAPSVVRRDRCRSDPCDRTLDDSGPVRVRKENPARIFDVSRRCRDQLLESVVCDQLVQGDRKFRSPSTVVVEVHQIVCVSGVTTGTASYQGRVTDDGHRAHSLRDMSSPKHEHCVPQRTGAMPYAGPTPCACIDRPWRSESRRPEGNCPGCAAHFRGAVPGSRSIRRPTEGRHRRHRQLPSPRIVHPDQGSPGHGVSAGETAIIIALTLALPSRDFIKIRAGLRTANGGNHRNALHIVPSKNGRTLLFDRLRQGARDDFVGWSVNSLSALRFPFFHAPRDEYQRSR